MTTATLSPTAGRVEGWAIRAGLSLATWGLARATRRADRDRQVARFEARTAAQSALAERDALLRSSIHLLS
ncbi:hypothetical protein GE115_16005 [Agromyces sp. CFH 90414]|uniref:Uncharacterized protein n=1 Tax=Agromyces agglutinans TaxID=2662258 RepID=A0A6I2FAH5_9MICO|nr:hypothetical protein [Agromyces agglutinans]MRG61361.1 hypothetical protein [Agromyces agglutinans]